MKQLGFSSRKWTYNNPVLPERTIGIETDTNKIKIGDGVTNWNDLPYLSEGYVKEAPIDGKQYARKDEAWTEVVATGEQSDWNETDSGSEAFIKNKPTIPSVDGLASETYVDNAVSPKADKSYVDSELSGKIGDAPKDSKQYTRKDGAWAEVILDANKIYNLIEEPEGDGVYEFTMNLTNNPVMAGMGYYGYLNNTENPEAMGTLSGYSSPSFIDSITALYWTKFADYGEEHWLSEAHVTGSSLDIFEQPIGHLNEEDEVVWHYKLRATVDNTFVIEGDIMMEDENSWYVGAILSQGDYPTVITATEGSYPVKLEIIKKEV